MSDGNILTEPTLQNDSLLVQPAVTVTVPGATWTVILTPDPDRQAFLVLPSLWNVEYHVSPQPVGAVAGGGWRAEPLPTIVHGAVYPLLIAGQWWAYSPLGIALTIVEVIRREG